MPIDKIAEIILNTGLWSSSGKTPKSSIASSIYCDMRHEGSKSRFIKTHAGTIDLRYNENLFFVDDGQSSAIRERVAVKNFTLEVEALPPSEFEEMIRKIMQGAGIREIERINRSKKDEVNLVGYITVLGSVSIRIHVLAARWKSGKIPSSTIDRVRRSVNLGDRGIVFSTKGFSRDAFLAAESDGEPPIALFGPEEMEKMLQK